MHGDTLGYYDRADTRHYDYARERDKQYSDDYRFYVEQESARQRQFAQSQRAAIGGGFQGKIHGLEGIDLGALGEAAAIALSPALQQRIVDPRGAQMPRGGQRPGVPPVLSCAPVHRIHRVPSAAEETVSTWGRRRRRRASSQGSGRVRPRLPLARGVRRCGRSRRGVIRFSDGRRDSPVRPVAIAGATGSDRGQRWQPSILCS